MDDSVKGEIQVPSIGFFDFLIKKDVRLPSNMSQSVSLQEIKLTSGAADKFLLAQKGLTTQEYNLMFAHQDDPLIKPEWIGGSALLGINKLEQFLANRALSSYSLYPHMTDHSPSEHFGHLDHSDST